MKISKLKLFLIISTILYISFFSFLNYKTYTETKDEPAIDGTARYGYPFTFYSYGGYCIDPSTDYIVGCGTGYQYDNLALDLTIVLGVPVLINLLVLWLSKKK